MPRALLLAFAACAASISGLACSENTFTGGCTTNEQCPVGAYCKAGLCACRTSEACAPGEECNTQGICQKRQGCRANTDCQMTEFCNILSGQCIPRTACGSDVHCVPGQVCDRRTSQCVDGCHETGDCPLYAVCDRSRAGSSTAALGLCLSGRCGDKSFCPYGQKCTSGECVPDTNPQHCKECDPRKLNPMDPMSCGSLRNFCLLNPNYDPMDPRNTYRNYCGVECNSQEDCPSGYGCGPVRLLTQDVCRTDQDCGGGGRRCIGGEGTRTGGCTCANDADCNIDRTSGGVCVGKCGGVGAVCLNDDPCLTRCDKSQGTCLGMPSMRCTMNEQCPPSPICSEVVAGQRLCLSNGQPCQTNDECLCYAEMAAGGAKVCYGSGRPCNTAADCKLACQDGTCFLGNACGPDEGLQCADVR